MKGGRGEDGEGHGGWERTWRVGKNIEYEGVATNAFAVRVTNVDVHIRRRRGGRHTPPVASYTPQLPTRPQERALGRAFREGGDGQKSRDMRWGGGHGSAGDEAKKKCSCETE